MLFVSLNGKIRAGIRRTEIRAVGQPNNRPQLRAETCAQPKSTYCNPRSHFCERNETLSTWNEALNRDCACRQALFPPSPGLDEGPDVILRARDEREGRCSARLWWRSFSPTIEVRLWVDERDWVWKSCHPLGGREVSFTLGWKRRVTQVQPQPIQPEFYGHTDAAAWKDVWKHR